MQRHTTLPATLDRRAHALLWGDCVTRTLPPGDVPLNPSWSPAPFVHIFFSSASFLMMYFFYYFPLGMDVRPHRTTWGTWGLLAACLAGYLFSMYNPSFIWDHY